MLLRVFVGVVAVMATVSQGAGQVISGPYGPVEFIGLQRWDAQEPFDAVRELDPGSPFHACAAVMKQDLGFADAAAFLYVKNSERYTVVVGVEDSARVRYRPPGREAVTVPENWEILKAVVGEDMRTVTAAAHTLPTRDGFFRRIFNSPRRLAKRMGADPRTLDRVWNLVDRADGEGDRRLAHEVLARDSSSSARVVATLVLGNFDDDDTSWHALVGSLVDSDTPVRTVAQRLLEGMITRDRDPVDWSAARAFLRTVSGENHGVDIEAWSAWVKGGFDRR